jgi:hypothetical protein
MAGIWDQLQYVLKFDYLGPIREQLNSSTIYLAQIEKTSRDTSGEGLRIPLHVSRNSGVGARGSSGTAILPTAGQQGYQRVTVLTKDLYACISLYGKAMRVTRNDKGAFLRALRAEIDGAVTDAKMDAERQLVAGDTTGTLATVHGVVTSDVIPVHNSQYLEEGMVVDVGGDTGCVIKSVDSETQITLTGSITTGDNDIIKRTGVTSGDELNGLALMLSNTSTLMGLDVATYPFWKANIVGSAGSPVALTELDMLEACDLVAKKGSTVDFAITGFGGRRAFVNMLYTYKQFTNEKITLKGGFDALAWSAGEKSMPITVNRFWPESSTETSIGFLTLKEIALGTQANWSWMEEDGNILARQTGAGKKEAYEGTLVNDCEHITYKRNAHSLLSGVTPL